MLLVDVMEAPAGSSSFTAARFTHKYRRSMNPNIPVGRVPLCFRRLIKTEVPSPLNMRPTSPSLVEDPYMGIAKGVISWDQDKKALPLPQWNAVRRLGHPFERERNFRYQRPSLFFRLRHLDNL